MPQRYKGSPHRLATAPITTVRLGTAAKAPTVGCYPAVRPVGTPSHPQTHPQHTRRCKGAAPSVHAQEARITPKQSRCANQYSAPTPRQHSRHREKRTCRHTTSSTCQRHTQVSKHAIKRALQSCSRNEGHEGCSSICTMWKLLLSKRLQHCSAPSCCTEVPCTLVATSSNQLHAHYAARHKLGYAACELC